jgi:hypothetical protein
MPERGDDGFHPMMSTCAASLSQSHLAKRKVKVIVNNDYITTRDSMKRNELGDRGPAQIHVGLRLGKENALVMNHPISQERVKAATREGEVVSLGKAIEDEKTDIMAIQAVLNAGVTEPDD